MKNSSSLGLGSVLRTAAKEIWERLGLVLSMSATWSLLMLIGLMVGQSHPHGGHSLLQNGLAALLATLLVAPATGGVMAVAALILADEPVGYGEFWRGGRSLAGAAIRLSLVHLLVSGLLTLNLWFYAHIHSVTGMVAMLLTFDALLLWGMMAVYHFPLLVAQENGLFDTSDNPPKRGVRPILRRAFLLALRRPAYSAGLLFAALFLTMLLLPVPPLMILLWPAALAILLTAGTRSLLIQYGVIVLPPQEPIIPDEKFRVS